jgi:2',3'-cyclic-nucleotide 2'-phosphodiesterase
MNILYVGDIMGEAGIEVIEKIIPDLRRERQIDFIIAQAENVSEGKGISETDFRRLQKTGIDFCTGGNWTLNLPEIIPALSDPAQPIIRPANYPVGTPGLGFKSVNINGVKICVISLLGHIVGKDSEKPTDNPLKVIDKILSENSADFTVVNFHGDYSSEKVVIGHYLDGRVTAVVGDHWHVPTADARVLPKGTAHISDVGMCGVLDASLGVKFSSILPRWRDDRHTRNVLETDGPKQFNAVLVKSSQMGLADSIEQIQRVF